MKFFKSAIKKNRPVAALYRRYVSSLLYRNDPNIKLAKRLAKGGDIALDVGANTGVFTRALAPEVRTVHAFEPFAALIASIKDQKIKNAVLHNIAIGAENGHTNIRAPIVNGLVEFGLATTSLDNELQGSNDYYEENVTVCKLDDIDLGNDRNIDFVKIDVEGSEMSVLDGMKAILGKFRPSILLEIEKRHNNSWRDVFSELEKFGYSSYIVDAKNKVNKIETEEVSVRQQVYGAEAYVNNFFFLQESHTRKIQANEFSTVFNK